MNKSTELSSVQRIINKNKVLLVGLKRFFLYWSKLRKSVNVQIILLAQILCCVLDNSAPTAPTSVFFLKQQWRPYPWMSNSGNWALTSAREDALGRNRTLFRLWISKAEIKLIVRWNFLFPLSFPLVWHPCLRWVCFVLKYSISLKGRFSLRCYFQSFASKTSETKLDWKTVSENG